MPESITPSAGAHAPLSRCWFPSSVRLPESFRGGCSFGAVAFATGSPNDGYLDGVFIRSHANYRGVSYITHTRNARGCCGDGTARRYCLPRWVKRTDQARGPPWKVTCPFVK